LLVHGCGSGSVIPNRGSGPVIPNGLILIGLIEKPQEFDKARRNRLFARGVLDGAQLPRNREPRPPIEFPTGTFHDRTPQRFG
jgi:hypothetical protein